MPKVKEMLGDTAVPAGEVGRDIDQEQAMGVANGMRMLLLADLPEEAIARGVHVFSAELDSDLYVAAWEFLNAGERRAWKAYMNYEEWLRYARNRPEA
jgi:hypothetical protein